MIEVLKVEERKLHLIRGLLDLQILFSFQCMTSIFGYWKSPLYFRVLKMGQAKSLN